MGNNPYRWIQERFLEAQFKDSLSGQRWLDFGCGIGYFTKFFYSKGAEITGIDPSPHYVSLAKKHFSNGGEIQYLLGDGEDPHSLPLPHDLKFDRIFVSDVLLYFFEPYKPSTISPVDFLLALKKRLKPDGRIFILDPHGFFHLNGWLNDSYPFLVATEYRRRKFRVTPNLSEIAGAFSKAGFVIQEIKELYADEDVDSIPKSHRAFAQEFPLWWFFELSSR